MRSEHVALLLLVVAVVLIKYLILWFQTSACKPDPWGKDVDDAVHQSNAAPLCYRCLSPHDEDCCFCPECGSATGLYNNLNPYLYIFSLGEMLRLGVSGPIKRNVTTILGYLLLSLSEYLIFAPLYWFFLFRNLLRLRHEVPASGSAT
jgi:hypothetical protein